MLVSVDDYHLLEGINGISVIIKFIFQSDPKQMTDKDLVFLFHEVIQLFLDSIGISGKLTFSFNSIS